jgi:hypothetical protein
MASVGQRVREGDPGTLVRKLAVPAVAAGLLGGLFMIVVMILVMGAAGMGYASPLNLGMPAFVFTITPPLAMLPTLMSAMGITLPPSVMAQLTPALHRFFGSPGGLGADLTR